MKYLKALSIAVAVAVVAGAAAYGYQARSKNGGETVAVTRGELVKTVRVSGKVVAEESVNLGFELGGIVASVDKRVGDRVAPGDRIASLDSAGLSANLLRARAELASAQAELASLQGGDEETKLRNAELAVAQAIAEAYSSIDDAIRNKVDQFISNPRTPNPEILPIFDDYSLRLSINKERVAMEELLRGWAASKPAIGAARASVARVSSFLNDVSRAVNDFEPTTLVTQTMIDKYKADVASARQAVNAVASKLLSAEEGLRSDRSGVPVVASRVDAAMASVLAYEAELAKTSLASPIAGLVSRQDAKVGQAVSAHASLATVISNGFKIEAFVPEVSIAGVEAGNAAKVTLDAYGSDAEFAAAVSRIDPAETVREGVSNYKVDLAFVEPDARVRSGMTANVTIETLRKPGVLMVPARAVLSKDGAKIVLAKRGEVAEETVIQTGIMDSQGNVEVLSGLAEGDLIYLDPVAKR